MKRNLAGLVLILITGVGICAGATVEHIGPHEMSITVTSELSEFSFETIDGFDYIRGSDLVYLPRAGVPGLPRRPVHITVPWDCRVESIEVTYLSETAVAGTYRIAPTQPPVILGQPQPEWVSGRQEIYADELPAISLYYPASMSAYNPRKGIQWFYTKGGIALGIPIAQNKMSVIK